jgi:membrane protein DedA with SNARE-associated domain
VNLDLPALIQSHGYLVLVIGCLLEGETLLALAGFAAHEGYLHLPTVIAVAAAAGFVGDQIFFWIGRRHGDWALARLPSVSTHVQRVHRLIERWGALVVVLVRFAYGLRIAGPVIIGTSRFSAVQFAIYNALGAVLWATLIASLGWLFGRTIERLLGDIHRFELWALGLAFVAFVIWLVHRRFAARQR